MSETLYERIMNEKDTEKLITAYAGDLQEIITHIEGKTKTVSEVMTNNLARLRAELERVKAENEWIPVSVRLPREDEVVIVVNEQMTVFPSWYHGTFFYQQAEDLSPVSFPVTHWKPLPAAPEEGE